MLQQRWGSFTSTAGKGIDRACVCVFVHLISATLADLLVPGCLGWARCGAPALDDNMSPRCNQHESGGLFPLHRMNELLTHPALRLPRIGLSSQATKRWDGASHCRPLSWTIKNRPREAAATPHIKRQAHRSPQPAVWPTEGGYLGTRERTTVHGPQAAPPGHTALRSHTEYRPHRVGGETCRLFPG